MPKWGGKDHSSHIADDQKDGEAGDIRIPGLNLKQIYHLALAVPGFKNGGIGIYPDAGNRFVHVDVRGERARWGRVKGKDVSLEEALAHV